MPVAGLAGAHRAIDAALGINDGNSSSGKHNHQLCLSLLPLFSFSDANHVLHQDWLRGCKALRLHEMADDKELWQQLLDTYGNASHSAIELAKISFLVPMEPHISLLFRAMVDGLSRIVDVATGQQNKEAKRTKTLPYMYPIYFSAFLDGIPKKGEIVAVAAATEIFSKFLEFSKSHI